MRVFPLLTLLAVTAWACGVFYWLVPWSAEGVYRELSGAQCVGVAFFYDPADPRLTEEYLAAQAEKVAYFRGSAYIFVNLAARTEPWRGEQERLAEGQAAWLVRVLAVVANLTDGGRGVAAGLSEMSRLALEDYVRAYRLIRERLPRPVEKHRNQL